MENYENIRLPWPDWRIVRPLGSGAYGKVYEIERNISGIQEKAALKIISRPKDSSEIEAYYDNGYDQASIAASYQNELQNYAKEYKLMRELQGQSNIVSCDDFTIVPHKNGIGGVVFIRMELLTSLQQVLRERTLSEREIIKLGKDISRALILCESKNIVHRDIKPVNIMISSFGDYKLGDFGVSKIMDHNTFGTPMGTPEYQAPEVVHMEKYGNTADIYSLGITLYWLLNNRKMPFISADEMMTPMVKNAAKEKRYRGERIPAPKNGSAKLKQIVLKACEYRPEDRYASARELYAELDALGEASESGSRQGNRTLPKGSDIHKTLSITENEIGTTKTVCVQYPNGQEKAFDVNVPTGITNGQSIRLRGQGMTTAGGRAGDLYLKVVVSGNNENTWNYAQKEKNSWGDSWGESFGSIGNPGGRAQKAQGQKKAKVYHAEDFGNHVEGDIFGELFGKDSSSTVGIKNAARKKNEAKKPNENGISLDQILAEISVEKTTAGNITMEIFIEILFCGGGVFLFAVGAWLIGIILIVFGIVGLTGFGTIDFTEWMKKNKEKVKNIDDLIKNNPEFAKRLYYQKCPKKHLLEYMEKLNPAVVNEIKASKR
ncbi:MAG: protein kinase [Clostridiales bacterium]|nr:protein kinase [Clostridiales bacterium]